MAITLRFKRGDTSTASTFIGAEGELYVDTDKDTLVIHDGITAGGFPLATETFVLDEISNIDALPSQSGNNGKFLTTDGSTASWGDVSIPPIPVSLLDLGITDGTYGQALVTDGAGNFSFVNVSGVGGQTYFAGTGLTESAYTFSVNASQTQITEIGTLTNLTVTNTISGSINGNAATVTNGVYTNDSYSNPAWITSLAGAKISGNITGNAGNITGTYGGSLTSLQVTNALGFTPYDETNPDGYTTNLGTVTSVSGAGTVSGLTLTGTVTGSGSLTLGGTLSLSSTQVTDALGYTPATTGNAEITSLGVGTTASGTSGEIRATNEVTAYYSSDVRLKENITTIENALDKIKSLRGVMFDWKDEVIESRGGEDGFFVRRHDTGIIAQEVESVLPEIVANRDDGYKAVKYEKLAGLIIQAINELAIEVEAIKNKVGE